MGELSTGYRWLNWYCARLLQKLSGFDTADIPQKPKTGQRCKVAAIIFKKTVNFLRSNIRTVQITIQLEGFEKDYEKSKDDRGKDDLRGKELSRHEATVNKEKRSEPEESLYSQERKTVMFFL
jgi:hypothetical protein